jgi:hypothetical protein
MVATNIDKPIPTTDCSNKQDEIPARHSKPTEINWTLTLADWWQASGIIFKMNTTKHGKLFAYNAAAKESAL